MPNVRWFYEKRIEEEKVIDQTEEELKILRFMESIEKEPCPAFSPSPSFVIPGIVSLEVFSVCMACKNIIFSLISYAIIRILYLLRIYKMTDFNFYISLPKEALRQ